MPGSGHPQAVAGAGTGLPAGPPVPWLAASLSLGDIAALVLEATVPHLAAAAAMFALEEVLAGGAPPQPAGGAPDAAAAVTARRIGTGFGREGRPAPDPAFPAGEVMVFAAGSPYARCVRDAVPLVFGPPDGQVLEQAGYRPAARKAMSGFVSYLAVPMIAAQRVTGFLVFARERGAEPFRHEDAGQLAGLAARAAACVLSACQALAAPPRVVAPRAALETVPGPGLHGTVTCDTITCDTVPHDTVAAAAAGTVSVEAAGLEVAGHCRAAPGQPAGGDWYDVLPLPGGRTGLLIGDAMGHDQAAAAAMGQLRAAAHALAGLDLPPAELLRRLDRTTAALSIVTLATCVYAVIHPAHRSCVVAGAGHLPPVLVHPDGTTSAPELPAGLPIGLGTAIYGQLTLPFPPGATLALYTDGLVDTRVRSSQHGIGVLRSALADPARGPGAGPLGRCCDRLVTSLAPRPEDDTTLVLARLRPGPVTPPPVPL